MSVRLVNSDEKRMLQSDVGEAEWGWVNLDEVHSLSDYYLGFHTGRKNTCTLISLTTSSVLKIHRHVDFWLIYFLTNTEEVLKYYTLSKFSRQ